MTPRTLLPLCLLLAGSPGWTYDNVKAHPVLNDAILSKFLATYQGMPGLGNYAFQPDIGTLEGPGITAGGWFNVTTSDVKWSPRRWITEGGYSADEPEVPAAYRHFFDPTATAAYLTDLPSGSKVFKNPQIDAIRWHFEGIDPSGANPWTWNAGRGFFAQALATSNAKTRDRLMAKAFRCLGEVLHNTADMACPPHVRNDAHGGMGLGGSDPYESLFDPAWVPTLSKGTPSPAVVSLVSGAGTARELNMALAAWTNQNFFSGETIAGVGTTTVKSANGKPDFALPRLERLRYDPKTCDFYREELVGGTTRRVNLANDYSVIADLISTTPRGTPSVTLENVQSQAADLVPALTEVGASIIARYLPRLAVDLKVSADGKTLSGAVRHVPSVEYPKAIAYQGPVQFMVNDSVSGVTAMAKDGKFSVAAPGNGKVKAFIEIGSLQVNSPVVTASAPAAPASAGVQSVFVNVKLIGDYLSKTYNVDGKVYETKLANHDQPFMFDPNSGWKRTGANSWRAESEGTVQTATCVIRQNSNTLASFEFTYSGRKRLAKESGDTTITIVTRPVQISRLPNAKPGEFSGGSPFFNVEDSSKYIASVSCQITTEWTDNLGNRTVTTMNLTRITGDFSFFVQAK